MSVTLRIDGTEVEVEAGTSILSAARAAGIRIPTLCDSPRLKPYGACRLCMVEVEGSAPVASCHTPVREGMEVRTRTPFLRRLRRNVVELVVSDHPLDCLGCPANGACELQTVAAETGFRELRFPSPERGERAADASHPFLVLDMEKCIACARCVRVCDEVQGSFVLAMEGRGFGMRVLAGDDAPLSEAGCTSCGACALECPVAAIMDRGRIEHGTADRVVATTCAYCAVGCSLDVHVADDRVAWIEPRSNGSANGGHACVKGRFAHGFARSRDRLRAPLRKGGDGTFHEITWEEALDFAAARLTEIRDRHGPGAFAAISSSRCTNEENYLMQKFTRTVMGTNSIDNCSRVCHSPSAFALGKALGTGAGTNSFEDIDRTDCILLIGANPTEAHPVFGARIKRAVLAGARLLVLDPRRIELAKYADLHLQLDPGSNVAVVNALQQVCLEEGLYDEAFVSSFTEGFETYREEMASFTPERAQEISGVPADDIRKAARIYASAERASILWGLGVTEAANGSLTVFGLINLALMTGNFGKPGTGANPIRGQNNVQGASDVGALPNVFSDYRPVADAAAREDHRRIWGVEIPEDPGLTIPKMFEAALEGRLKGMWITAEDVAQSDPNTGHVVAALDSLDFLIVQEIFMNETAKHADLVLPGATFLEKDGTFVNSDRRIQRVRRVVPPLKGCLPDGDIVQEVALRMGADLGFGTPPDPAKVMEEISRLSPNWGGVSYERLERPGAFLQWPCRSPEDPGTSIVHKGGRFLRGKGLFHPTPWKGPAETPDEEYPFFLTTGRQLFHYNVGTMTRRTPVVELAAASRERLRIHPVDAERLGVRNGERVRVLSRRGEVEVEAEVEGSVKPGTVFMTFHFPETRTNLLLSSAADEFTGCPEYKVSAVRIEACARKAGE